MIVFGKKFLRTAAIDGNDVDAGRFPGSYGEKYDLLSVGRPTRQRSVKRWIAELETVGTIGLAAPQRAFRERNVRDPLTVVRKYEVFGGNPIEKWNEAVRARFLANEFTARPAPDDKKALAVFTRQR